MKLTLDTLKTLTAGTKLELLGYSCDLTLEWVGLDARNMVVVYENGALTAYAPEFITGRNWAVLDLDGYIVPSAQLGAEWPVRVAPVAPRVKAVVKRN